MEYDIHICGTAIRVTQESANAVIYEMQNGKHTLISFDDVRKQRHVVAPAKIDRISSVSPSGGA